jgi:hypothetical protein
MSEKRRQPLRARYRFRWYSAHAARHAAQIGSPLRWCRFHADTVPHGADGEGPGDCPTLAPLRWR